jgi:hypothetical protein
VNKAFVIGDVHGHLDRLENLLSKVSPTQEDKIIQLGDLGHFGYENPTADILTYKYAIDHKINVLWGNHDYATVSPEHRFAGYKRPVDSFYPLLREVGPKIATISHGYLLSHAGLHPSFAPATPLTNEELLIYIETNVDLQDTIGRSRGGYSLFGGILWRDDAEDLWTGIPQIFGHTSSSTIRKEGLSFCIDIGKKDGNSLAGIWLPSLEIIKVE